MKYARSVLATTVLAVFGLGVAVQNLHSRDSDAPMQPIRPTAASSAAPLVQQAAWTDPPTRGASVSTETRPSARSGALPAVAAPSVLAAVPAPTPALAEPRRSAAVRRKTGERNRIRVASLRHSSHARTAAVDPAAIPQPAPRPAPDAAGRIDPIGDILRGLGFGRDG